MFELKKLQMSKFKTEKLSIFLAVKKVFATYVSALLVASGFLVKQKLKLNYFNNNN
jgi:hypothetical protein